MSDLRTFFCDLTDALVEHAKREAVMDRIRAKQKQIHSLEERRCGNCLNWMTRGCVPEQNDKRIRSMNDSCVSHFEGGKYNFLKEKFREELDEMTRLSEPTEGEKK